MIDRGSGSYQDVVAPKKTGLSSLLDKAKGFLQEAVQQQRTKSLAERELYEDAPIVKPQTKDISTKFLDTTTENLLDNFLLQNENDINEFACTYNVDYSTDIDYNKVKSTISLHRKKHSNTLYTINALNELIKNLNNGVLNKDYIVPWENFKNMILVTNSEGLNRISTRIFKIINVND